MHGTKSFDWGNPGQGVRSRMLSGLWLLPLMLSACAAADNKEEVGNVGQAVTATTPANSSTSWGAGRTSTPSYKQVLSAQQAADAADKRSEKAVWVVLKQKPGLASAATSKDWKVRGKQVHDALTTTASKSQASLIAYLSEKQIAYKPFWIANAVKIRADAATIDEIAKRSDVAKIVKDGGFSIEPPKRTTLAITPKAIEWNIENIRAPEAWDKFGARGDGIVVASIDTGVEYTHPAVARQYRGLRADGSYDHNYNWSDPSNICGKPSSAPCDNAGHGTHTMGTILGDDGGDNQVGVAPAAKWITAKGCEDYSCSYEALLSAGQWMIAPTDLNGQNPRPDLRPHVVSNSWGGGYGDEFYREVVQAWVAAGMFPVFAAGNEGSSCGSVSSPGDYPESYAVGAYDSRLNIAYFSSRGPSYLGEIKPNIAAPGVNVRSSVPGGMYDYYDGTSMATPHVAGTVALMWSISPALLGDVGGTRTILDEAATDHDDTSCGGTPEFNATWGQGMLDAYRAVELSPPGQVGYLTGTVAEQGGLGLSGATVALAGAYARTTQTAADGTYSVRAPVGFYAVTASQFAFYSQTVNGVEVTEGNTTTQNFALERAPSFPVAGIVRDEEGEPVEGATVTLLSTPIAPVVTDATGAFSFGSVPAGEYRLTVNAGGCLEPFAGSLTVDGSENVPVTMDSRVDEYGYTCRLVPIDFIEADTPVSMRGENGTANISLPFSFMLYGRRFEKGIVSPAGYLSFSGPSPMWDNLPIPDPTEPNSAVFPFWDDNYMDSESSAGTKVIGTAPNRKFVMEWRDVAVDFNFDTRVTFEVILSESNGEILFQYLKADATGASATIGIENATGTIGHQYSYNKPAVKAGMAIRYTIPHSGVTQGVVTDKNDGLVVKNAEVVAVDTTGKRFVTSTDDLGRYAFQAKAGTYALSVNKKNYGPATGSATIVEGGTSTNDFSLATPRAEASPTSIQLVVPTNVIRTRAVTLANTGSLPMSFSINESGGKRQTVASAKGLKRKTNANLNAITTKGLYEETTPPKGWSVMETGDTLFSFTPTGLQMGWGIGQSNNLWISDAYELSNTEFTLQGAPTGARWDASWAGSFPGDMALLPSQNLMCQVAVGADNGIHCWDPASGKVEQTITGSPWTSISQRGLAYREDDDSFYIGGWNEGVIYHVQGLSGDQPGKVISSCMPSDPNISGLAYNNAMGVLWMATNSQTDTIYQLNAEDCTVLSTLKHPQSGGYQGTGLEMDSEGNLWTLSQSPNTAFLIDSGVPAFSDVPWMSVTPASGTVAAGGKSTLAFTLNTSGLESGVYLASIFINTNSGRLPRIRIPISLIVSAYQQAVNAGGPAYTDGNGDPWAADQAWSAGSWGYMQKGSVITTKKTIAGTTEQVLFQSQRSDPYAYRFDDVPNGIYEIDLRSAELQGIKMGKRLYDVIVENTTVLPAHDIAYDVGQLTADVHKFFIAVEDNRMDVRFIPRTGYKLPVINALRVTQRPDR